MTLLSFQKGFERRQESLSSKAAYNARFAEWVNPYAGGIDTLVPLPALPQPKPAASVTRLFALPAAVEA